jgi:hypothetical protein
VQIEETKLKTDCKKQNIRHLESVELKFVIVEKREINAKKKSLN